MYNPGMDSDKQTNNYEKRNCDMKNQHIMLISGFQERMAYKKN